MPRLFTGLEIPRDVAARLSLFAGGLSGARWIDADNYHITLRFLGDVDLATANAFAEALDRVARPAFGIRVDALGVFGGRQPRTLYARVAGTPVLSALHADHERAARQAGLPPETRNFAPHVTLARLRSVAPEAAAGWLALRGSPKESFPAHRFVLYSARDSVGGGPYVVEETWPLQEAAASAEAAHDKQTGT